MERDTARPGAPGVLGEAGGERAEAEHARRRERPVARHDVHQAAIHVVAAIHVRDPVAGEQRRGFSGIKGIHKHHRRTCAEGGEHAVEPEHPAERQRGQ